MYRMQHMFLPALHSLGCEAIDWCMVFYVYNISACLIWSPSSTPLLMPAVSADYV